MNILPKKRWHVRTKDNIARVRRDEAKAAEEEKAREARALLAEQEARTALLRTRARQKLPPGEPAGDPTAGPSNVGTKLEHVNFFSDLEAGETTHTANKEHEEEKKKEQEEYEKKIGYLTYLGQDTHELTGERSWWQQLPEDRRKKYEEDAVPVDDGGEGKTAKLKEHLDPLKDVRKYLGCEGVQRYMGRTKKDMRNLATAVAVPKSSDVGKKDGEAKRLKRKQSTSSDSSSSDSEDSGRERKRRKKKKKDRKASRHSKSKHKKDKKKHKKKAAKSKKKKTRRRSSSASSSSEPDKELKAMEEEEERRRKEEQRRKMDRLRMERLEREKVERARANKVLYGEPEDEEKERDKKDGGGDPARAEGRKYNTQFNPQCAKQNKLDANKKYWLE